MLKPICVKCHRFFRPKKTGYYFIEGMPVGTDVKPGNAEPDKWIPYKIWCGDLWECQGCGATIISGSGIRSVRDQHHDDFKEMMISLGARQFQVNDC